MAFATCPPVTRHIIPVGMLHMVDCWLLVHDFLENHTSIRCQVLIIRYTDLQCVCVYQSHPSSSIRAFIVSCLSITLIMYCHASVAWIAPRLDKQLSFAFFMSLVTCSLSLSASISLIPPLRPPLLHTSDNNSLRGSLPVSHSWNIPWILLAYPKNHVH